MWKLNFPNKKYKTIVIDPAWNLPSVSPSHNLKFKITGSLPYKTMTDEELMQLPINNIADDSCQLFVWVTHGTLPIGLELIKNGGLSIIVY